MLRAVQNGCAIYIDLSNGDSLDAQDQIGDLIMGRGVTSRALANMSTQHMPTLGYDMSIFRFDHAMQLVAHVLHTMQPL